MVFGFLDYRVAKKWILLFWNILILNPHKKRYLTEYTTNFVCLFLCFKSLIELIFYSYKKFGYTQYLTRIFQRSKQHNRPETDDFINKSGVSIKYLIFISISYPFLRSGLLVFYKELQVSINLNCQCMASLSLRSHQGGWWIEKLLINSFLTPPIYTFRPG